MTLQRLIGYDYNIVIVIWSGKQTNPVISSKQLQHLKIPIDTSINKLALQWRKVSLQCSIWFIYKKTPIVLNHDKSKLAVTGFLPLQFNSFVRFVLNLLFNQAQILIQTVRIMKILHCFPKINRNVTEINTVRILAPVLYLWLICA